ncbi:amidohydrolase family protein [Hydrogenophaga sp. BPS33]|uniref:amidohydrolase family protein n=1 Tax=Hydrogenophaga sp. BPS33 TaxID=2651974 RepID=UPI00131F5349|nr:amidohydrolase family protein [Hydrogenophaga sp. BPS33]QHE87385.1 amidohydrolase family protein [Hydrogenophaga sp. BPS33]
MPSTPPSPRSGLDRELIVRGGHVLTMDPALGDLPGGDVHVRDGAIVAVGSGLAANGVPEIDARDTIVLPGFVDTHWHLWNCALRALVRGDDPEHGYFPVTLGAGPLFTPEDSYRSVRLGLAEGLLSGITTVQNWAHNIRTPAHADAELRAMAEMGLRGRFAYGWGQDRPLDQAMDLDDLARVQRQGLPSDLLTLGAALRTPVTNPRGAVPIAVVSEEFASVRRLGLPLTMHARLGIVPALDEHGLLGKDLQLVHPQGMTESDCARMAATGTTITCSPTIEMLYAQATRGVIQFQEMEEAGVQQSLSVDSSGASANADFFACMRALLWSHKQRFGSRQPLSARRLLRLATLDGARDLGLDALIGSLTPGKRADIQIVRATDLNLAPVFDPAHALVYSAQPANVDTVLVDGRVLLRRGQPTRWDSTAIVRDAADAMRSLARRYAEA